MSTRRQVIKLYRQLLCEAKKFPSYNFRMYAIRKIRDTFRTNKILSDYDKIDKEIMHGIESLELIRRQWILRQRPDD